MNSWGLWSVFRDGGLTWKGVLTACLVSLFHTPHGLTSHSTGPVKQYMPLQEKNPKKSCIFYFLPKNCWCPCFEGEFRNGAVLFTWPVTLTPTQGNSNDAAGEGHEQSMVVSVQLEGNDSSVLLAFCITPGQQKQGQATALVTGVLCAVNILLIVCVDTEHKLFTYINVTCYSLLRHC